MGGSALAKLKVEIGFDDKGFRSGISGAVNLAKGFGKAIVDVLTTATGFLLAQGVDLVVRSVAGLVGAGVSFGQEMANVNSIAQLSEQALSALGDSVIAIAKDPRIAAGPAELAAGLYNIYSSGFQGAEGLNVLEKAAMAATAGVTTTEVAAKVGASALNAYGLSGEEAGRIYDVLFQTVNDGVISFEELANNMGNTLPIAASLGIQIEDLGAAYALMTLKGVNASAAETQISALMRSALAPTDALTAAVKAHGYETAEALIRAEGMTGYLKLLGEASGGSQSELLKLLGTQEAMNAATILGEGNAEGYIAELFRMKDASKGTGATQAALAKQMKSASYQFAQVKKNAQIMATVLFKALEPTVAKAAKGIAGFLMGLTAVVGYVIEVVRGVKTVTESVGSMGTVFRTSSDNITDALDAVPKPLRGIALVLGDVIVVVKNLLSAFSTGEGVNQIIDRWFGPDAQGPLVAFARSVLVIADSIGDLVSAFQKGGLSGLLDVFGEEVSNIRDELMNMAGIAVDFVFDTAVSIAGWLWDHKGDIWGGIKSIVGWTTDTFTDAITATIDGAVKLAGDLFEASKAPAQWIWNRFFKTGDFIFPMAIFQIAGEVDALGFADRTRARIASALSAIDWAGMWSGITTFFTGLWDAFQNYDYNQLGVTVGEGVRGAIEAVGPTLLEVGGKIMRSLYDGLKGADWQEVLKWVALIPIAIPAAIIGAATILGPKAAEFIKGLLDGLGLSWDETVVPWFKSLPGKALGAIDDLTETLKAKGQDLIMGLRTGASEWWDLFEGWLGGRKTWAVNKIGDLSETLLDKGKSLIQGLFDGAIQIWLTVSGWLGGIDQNITNAIGELGGVLFAAGEAIMQGLANGLQWAWDHTVAPLLSTFSNLIPKWKGPPSKDAKLLTPAGRLIMQGLGVGLAAGWVDVSSQLQGYTHSIAGMSSVAGYAGMSANVGSANSSGASSPASVSLTFNINGYDKDKRELADEVSGIIAREWSLMGGA